MIFTEPTDFSEAMQIAGSRDLLPTDLSSREIQERFSPDILRRSVFSARTDSALYLQEMEDELEEFLNGKTNAATVRKNLLAKLDELGYTPEHGFAESAGAVAPADEGGLRDLSSRGRLDLMIDTQARQQMNRGYIEQWNDPAQRAAFPAWELVRIAPREVPRGLKRTKAGLVPDPGNDWPSRWAKAGGSFYGGRMIALVDDGIWGRIGSTELFSDGLDNPYAPFAFGSGFGIRAVPAAEAEQLGVLSAGGKRSVASPAGTQTPEKLPPVPTSLNKEILAKLKAALDRELGDWDSGALMERELSAARGVKNRFSILNAGTTAGAIKGWITRRQGGILAGQAFDAAMQPGGHKMKARTYLKVDSSQAKMLKAATGLDLEGYEHAIDGSSVRHIMAHHGDPAAEAARGQKAITRADFAKLPQLIAKPDKITRSYTTKGGLETIAYERKTGDEKFFFEEVRTGQKKLVPKSLYKK